MNTKYTQLSILTLLLIVALVGLGLSIGQGQVSAAPQFAPFAAEADTAFEAIPLTASGAAGAASGSVTSTARLWGYVKGVYVDYGAAISETTDITMTTVSPLATVMILTDVFTDGWYYPSVQFTGATGAAVSGAYGRFPIYDNLTMTARESTSGTVATVYVYWGQ